VFRARNIVHGHVLAQVQCVNICSVTSLYDTYFFYSDTHYMTLACNMIRYDMIDYINMCPKADK